MSDDARSFVDVVRDVVSNVEDLVASEVRLARAEVTTEAKKAAGAGVVLAAGAIRLFAGWSCCCSQPLSGLRLSFPCGPPCWLLPALYP
jgi:hypothetical protein